MSQACRLLDFLLKCPDISRRGQQLPVDQLEGKKEAGIPAAGLEYLAEAACAKPFQEQIGAQQEFAGTALEELIDLKRREPAALHQLPR
jgi:hypothetical protein